MKIFMYCIINLINLSISENSDFNESSYEHNIHKIFSNKFF